MKSRQVDFSRVPNRSGQGVLAGEVGKSTISVDTSYITGGTAEHPYSYYETAARLDAGKFVQREYWEVLEQYDSRDAALAGHARWAAQVRENGIPAPEDNLA